MGEDVATRFLRQPLRPRRSARRRGARAGRAGARVLRARAPPPGRRRSPMSFQASYLPAALGEEVVQGRSRGDAAAPGARLQARHRDHRARARPSPRCRLERRAARELGCRPGIAALPLRPRLGRRRPAPRSSTTASSSPATASGSPANSTTTGCSSRNRVMKILVMIKQVPDTATQVKIGGDGKAIDTAGITWIVSPYDEFARRGGAPDQGEARPGRGGRGLARPRPRQGGAALVPGHGRRPRHPPERSRLGRRPTR